MQRILVVEDDIAIGNLLEELLKEKYEITRAFSGTEAVLQFEAVKPELVLLDLMLPGMTGEEVLKKISGKAKVIVISAKNSVDDKVGNLLAGANDYITKPFDNEEVLARVEVQLRDNKKTGGMLTVGDISVDEENHTVSVCGNEIRLTKLEYDILVFLMKNPNHVFSKGQIFEHVWNYDAIGNEESVKVHISNLRTKIAEFTENKYIETVWGIGFRLVKA